MKLINIVYIVGIVGIIFSNLLAKDGYYKAKTSINFKERMTKESLMPYDGIPPSYCGTFGLNVFEEEGYAVVASHYIARNKLICNKDMRRIKIEYISFDFGGINIKRQGSVISENKQYIKIKTLEGETFKIYKDGKRYR